MAKDRAREEMLSRKPLCWDDYEIPQTCSVDMAVFFKNQGEPQIDTDKHRYEHKEIYHGEE
jgi:hypothetical protein